KKTIEALALAGGFDCFENITRSQYFANGTDGINCIEKAIRYGNSVQQNAASNELSLFGAVSGVILPEPPMPFAEPWSLMQQLNSEKEIVGMYLSGHPLDPYKMEIDKLTTHKLGELSDLAPLKGREVKIAGIVTAADHRVTKNGKNYGSMTIEDYSGNFQMVLFQDTYINHRRYMEVGYFIYIKGRVENRWQRENDFEIKVLGIEMLNEVRDKYFNKITIQLGLEKVNQEMLGYFQTLSKQHPGNCFLNFDIVDHQDNSSIRMISTKVKFSPQNEILNHLEDLGLNYRLN
ncbi:MAG: DNA polymerase III subunit alpha, partial [Bacteroidia bacterium]|nr:DNA polymerase III subunit alpha [Bacteroidia bacterium]